MIKNFLFDISGCTGNYTLQGREMECLKYVKETVGSNKVLVSERGSSDEIFEIHRHHETELISVHDFCHR
jgi:hypothetical protein